MTDRRDVMARVAATRQALDEIAVGMSQTPRAGMWRSKIRRWSDEIYSLLALTPVDD